VELLTPYCVCECCAHGVNVLLEVPKFLDIVGVDGGHIEVLDEFVLYL
jgi:hypothetical protein